jgi:hypothetical protein
MLPPSPPNSLSSAPSSSFFASTHLRRAAGALKLLGIALATMVNFIELLANFVTKERSSAASGAGGDDADADANGDGDLIASRSASVMKPGPRKLHLHSSMAEPSLVSSSSPTAASEHDEFSATAFRGGHQRSHSLHTLDSTSVMPRKPLSRLSKRIRSSIWVERHIQQKR